MVTDEMNWQQFYSGTRADLKPGDRFYHGTRADLTPGDLIKPSHPVNFGKLDRVTTYVYFSATLDAGIWGAELALGEGPGRIYLVDRPGRLPMIPISRTKDFRETPRSRTAPENRCESWTSARVGRGTHPKCFRP